MTAPPRVTFTDRLELARRLIVRRAVTVPAPVHQRDQLAAAGDEARTLHDQIGTVLPLLDPDRDWRQRIDPDRSGDVRAYLLAAVMDCPPCPHVKRGGPQPAFILLAVRRSVCTRCVGTLRRPPPDEDDRCDLCGARGVTTFHPFAVRQGPALIAGDACPDCADVLGIRQEAAS